MTTLADLNAARVLWCGPDAVGLYSIPYDMRAGQQPGDIWRANRDWPSWRYEPRVKNPHDISDWLWLYSHSGWWGHHDKKSRKIIEAWLDQFQARDLPQNPYEWIRVQDLRLEGEL